MFLANSIYNARLVMHVYIHNFLRLPYSKKKSTLSILGGEWPGCTLDRQANAGYTVTVEWGLGKEM